MKRITDADLKSLIKPDTTQVFVLTCPAGMPFGFARHPWFIVNREGVISRWEVFRKPAKDWPTRWGHLHKNFYTLTQGIPRYSFSPKYYWKHSRLVGFVEGDLARQMADIIENTPRTYPWCNRYSLRGPNSNTYVAWVLKGFPTAGLALPWNSFGKSNISQNAS